MLSLGRGCSFGRKSRGIAARLISCAFQVVPSPVCTPMMRMSTSPGAYRYFEVPHWQRSQVDC